MPAQFYASLNPVASVKPGAGSAAYVWTQDTNAAGFNLNNATTVNAQQVTADYVAAPPGNSLWLSGTGITVSILSGGMSYNVGGWDNNGAFSLWRPVTGDPSIKLSGDLAFIDYNIGSAQGTIRGAARGGSQPDGLAIATNGLDRLVIDTAGHCTFNAADDSAPSLIVLGAGIQFPDGSIQNTASSPGGGGMPQTPWASDIAAVGFNLTGAGTITCLALNSLSGENLGISVDGALNVLGSGITVSSYAALSFNGSNCHIQTTAEFEVYTNGWNTRMLIDAAGHVNISASDDGAPPLAVTGDVNITGHYQRNGVPLTIQNQTDVTASRALGAVYQNNTGKTLFVLITLNLSSKAADVSFLTDASNPPVTVVSRISDDANAAVTNNVFAMVLPGNYYELLLNAGTPAITIWVEYS
jgi:hypothetical protein